MKLMKLTMQCLDAQKFSKVKVFSRNAGICALCGPPTKNEVPQRHMKVKLPSKPGITYSKAAKVQEQEKRRAAATSCRDFEILILKSVSSAWYTLKQHLEFSEKQVA